MPVLSHPHTATTLHRSWVAYVTYFCLPQSYWWLQPASQLRDVHARTHTHKQALLHITPLLMTVSFYRGVSRKTRDDFWLTQPPTVVFLVLPVDPQKNFTDPSWVLRAETRLHFFFPEQHRHRQCRELLHKWWYEPRSSSLRCRTPSKWTKLNIDRGGSVRREQRLTATEEAQNKWRAQISHDKTPPDWKIPKIILFLLH